MSAIPYKISALTLRRIVGFSTTAFVLVLTLLLDISVTKSGSIRFSRFLPARVDELGGFTELASVFSRVGLSCATLSLIGDLRTDSGEARCSLAVEAFVSLDVADSA